MKIIIEMPDYTAKNSKKSIDALKELQKQLEKNDISIDPDKELLIIRITKENQNRVLTFFLGFFVTFFKFIVPDITLQENKSN